VGWRCVVELCGGVGIAVLSLTIVAIWFGVIICKVVIVASSLSTVDIVVSVIAGVGFSLGLGVVASVVIGMQRAGVTT